MTQKWRGLVVNCPTCKHPATLQGVMFSADSEFMFLFFCHDCKENVQYRCFPSHLAWRALDADMEEKCGKCKQPPGQPLRPPLLLTAKPQTDDEFLKKMGIDPGGG